MSSPIYKKISLINGDITKIIVDAIVNAANHSLLGGGGVDGAIHSAAGPELFEECKTLKGCKTGEAKLTNAYNIETAKAIIHTVGPRIEDDVTEEDEQLLQNCYANSLNIAKQNGLKSIAFPCISTGIYCYPKEDACKIALQTIKNWLIESDNNSAIDKIVFCFFNDIDEKIYKRQFSVIFELTEDEMQDANEKEESGEKTAIEKEEESSEKTAIEKEEESSEKTAIEKEEKFSEKTAIEKEVAQEIEGEKEFNEKEETTGVEVSKEITKD